MSGARPDPGSVFRTALSAGEAARFAEELKANPLLKEILAELETGAMTVWRRSTSPQQREEQWYIVVTIDGVRRGIDSRIESVLLATRRDDSARKDRT